jgi:UDP-glucose 4-epimerase
MKWLVTGGCGFIGKCLIKRLVEEGGHYVRVLDNLSVGTTNDLASVCSFTKKTSQELEASASFSTNTVHLIQGDILSEEFVSAVVSGVDVVVHLAANTGVPKSVDDPRSDCLTNVVGTLNLLEAARCHKIRRFVFASSGAPVGECEPPITEEVTPHPVSPYGASKLAGEGYCSAYWQTFGIETVALRFGNVYGPGSGHKTSVVAKFIGQAVRGETLEIYGDGGQTRDFIFIDDIVNAIMLAAKVEKVSGEIFQIATNEETTVSELTEKLVTALNQHGIDGIEVRNVAERIGEVRRNYSDTSKAQRMLGWQFQIGVKEGLRRTVDWFLATNRLAS